MRRNPKFFLVFMILILMMGGCQLPGQHKDKKPKDMSADELPGVRAFQDDFTRKFMDSTEEVKDGYYQFRSGTDGYTMLFPGNGEIGEKSYGLSDSKGAENIDIGASMDKNVSYSVRVRYRAHEQRTDSMLDILRGMEDYRDGGFKKIKTKDTVIHYATNEFKSKKEKDTAYNFFSLIQSNASKQGVIFKYSITCVDADKPCHLDVGNAESQAKMMMKSVTFHNVNNEEGDQ